VIVIVRVPVNTPPASLPPERHEALDEKAPSEVGEVEVSPGVFAEFIARRRADQRDDVFFEKRFIRCSVDCAQRTVKRPPYLFGRLAFEYLVTLGERDPGLLAARPKMPRRPQPRLIVEAAGARTHYAAARLAIQPTCTIRAYEPGV
jgi:hypothetical protein